MEIPEFFKDIQLALKERASSPFWAPFFLAWCAVNYKLIVLVLSSGTAQEKLGIISSDLYPDLCVKLKLWLGFPSLIALIVILILPFFLNWLLIGHGKLERKIKLTKLIIDRDRAIGAKQEKILRRDIRRAQAEYQKEFESLHAEVDRFKNSNVNLRGDNEKLEKDNNELIELNFTIEKENKDLTELLEGETGKVSILQQKIQEILGNSENAQNGSTDKKSLSTVDVNLTEISKQLYELAPPFHQCLKYLFEKKSGLSLITISTDTNIEKGSAKVYLDKLMSIGYVQIKSWSNTNPLYSLSDLGLEATKILLGNTKK